jgi:predicted transposase YbfD/YdcC
MSEQEPEQEVIAVDGKTTRRSGDRAKGRPALHLVSAWASAHRLVLGQEAVAGKENEIVAIPRLLKMLELEGALVTIDALGGHKTIAQTIRDKGADYLLPVKGNQPGLREDLELFFTEQRARGFAHCRALTHETVDNDHGRLEIRRHWSVGDLAWLAERHAWPDLAGIGLIEREVERNGKTETSRHLYISSLPADAVLLARAARAHWASKTASTGSSTSSSTTTSAACAPATGPRTSPSSGTSPTTSSSTPRPSTNTPSTSPAKWPPGPPHSSNPSSATSRDAFKRFP